MIHSLTMKIATPKSDGFQKKYEPLLPLTEDSKLYKLDKTNSVTWELTTVPGTAGIKKMSGMFFVVAMTS
jgi:hypothetical protein